MELQEFLNGGFGGMGPKHGPVRDLHELGSDAELFANGQKRTGENDIHFGFAGDFLEIRNVLRVLRGNDGRTYDEIIESGERNGDGFRKAIGKEFEFFAAAHGW